MAQPSTSPVVHGVEITGLCPARFDAILTPEALDFVARLERRFRDTRNFLLMMAEETRDRLLGGIRPGFLPETAPVRQFDWKAAPVPSELDDRRVEIVVPPDAGRVAAALGSQARVLVVDLAGAMVPDWNEVIGAQVLLRAVARGEVRATDPRTGQPLAHGGRPPVLMVRPRGWAACEPHVRVDGLPVAAALFDFGVFLWHNARTLQAGDHGPYFRLADIESHLEARLWNDVFLFAQAELGLLRGTIKACADVDSVLAVFELDEILYQLREHSAGLAFGRQALLFSFLKRLGHDPGFVLPDGVCGGLDAKALLACRDLVVRTCHRRGVHAIAALAELQLAAVDPLGNAAEIANLRDVTWRDVAAGFDGTQLVDPTLVPLVAKDLTAPHQIDRLRADVEPTTSDLLSPARGPRTGAALRHELRLALVFLHAWQRGDAWPALDGSIVTLSTAETARAHVWQWLTHGVVLDDGTAVTCDLIDRLILEEVERLAAGLGEDSARRATLRAAAMALVDLVHAVRCPESLQAVAQRL